MFDILQDILQSHPFLMSKNFRNAELSMVNSQGVYIYFRGYGE